ncbi:MAG TPA: hypothetical protein VNN55_06230 [bacterium]|nr:hypothetical protein [bacterium]
MRNKRRKPGRGRVTATRHLNSLIDELMRIAREAEQSDSAMLVDLKRSIKKAKAIRRVIDAGVTPAMVVEAIVYIGRLAKRIYSFFNYRFAVV